MDKVNIILKEIKKGKSPKVVRSLDKLNKIFFVVLIHLHEST